MWIPMWIPKWIKEIYVIGKMCVDTFLKVDEILSIVATDTDLYKDIKYYRKLCEMQQELINNYCPQDQINELNALKESFKIHYGVKE